MPAVAFDENNEILSPTEGAYGSFYEAFQVFNMALAARSATRLR